MSGSDNGRLRIAVLADRPLVGQAVAAALWPRWIAPLLIAWPRRRDSARGLVRNVQVAEPSAGLILCDLASPDRLHDVETVVATDVLPWLVLTDSEPGPRWGAVLDAGAVAVLPTSTSLDTLVSAVQGIVAGKQAMDAEVRDRVLAQWREVAEDQRALIARMELLTPREIQVLHHLYDGRSVARIAEMSGVSESTVRSQVKSLRAKLKADSQLAAVAMYRKAQQIFPRQHDEE